MYRPISDSSSTKERLAKPSSLVSTNMPSTTSCDPGSVCIWKSSVSLFVIQGTPQRIQRQGDKYRLVTGSTHLYSDSASDQNELMSGETRPVFMARSDTKRNDLGVPGTRIFIYSAGGRSKWTWI